MERGDQVNLPALQTSAPIQTSAEDYLQRQQYTPVTQGENGFPPSHFDDGTASDGNSPPRRERHDPYGRTGGGNIARPPRVRSVHDGAMHRLDEDVLSPLRRGSVELGSACIRCQCMALVVT